MKKKVLLLITPLFLLGCNNSNVNTTKSPFNDKYNRKGIENEYVIESNLNKNELDTIKGLFDKEEGKYSEKDKLVKQYKKEEQTRDLKAAYFGKNLGAANLCRLVSKTSTKSRYENNVTIENIDETIQNQVINGSIQTNTQKMSDYTFESDKVSTPKKYKKTRSQKINSEVETESIVIAPTEYNDEDLIFGAKPYESDISQYFGEKTVREEKYTFNVFGNHVIYGKDKEGKFIIREATSVFKPYTTTVGDTVKAVNNFYYEAKLDKDYRFTNFRYYTEMLILSESYSDEERIPVLYLEKPQLVEYSEIRYTITYDSLGNYTGYIPKQND